jgi:hypothetical protein
VGGSGERKWREVGSLRLPRPCAKRLPQVCRQGLVAPFETVEGGEGLVAGALVGGHTFDLRSFGHVSAENEAPPPPGLASERGDRRAVRPRPHHVPNEQSRD